MTTFFFRSFVAVILIVSSLSMSAAQAPAAVSPVVIEDFSVGTATTSGYLLGTSPANGSGSLASVPLSGGSPTPLTAPNYVSYVVSPAGDRVVFYGAPYGVTLPHPNDSSRYWSVPVAGGTPVMLSEPTYAYPPLMQSPRFSPDGRTLTYIESDPALYGGGTHVLKSRLVDGSAPAARLSPDSGIVAKWAISPDSRWVVIWIGDSYGAVIGASTERWSIENSRMVRVPLHGPNSSAVTLDSTPGARGIYGTQAFSPDGSHMIYVLDGSVWSVNLTNGTKVRLSPDGQSVDPEAAALLVNPANVAIWNTGPSSPVFATPVTGPAAASRNLSAGLPGPILSQVGRPPWKASPGGDYVVMRVNEGVYSVAVNDPAASPVLLADGGGQGLSFWVTSDRLVFRTTSHIYSIPLQGPTGVESTVLVPISANLAANPISPDGSTIVGAMFREQTWDVFSVPVTGPSQNARNESYGSSQLNLIAADYWFFAPNSKHLVARDATMNTAYVFSIGSGPRTLRLSTDCSAEGSGLTVTPTPEQIHHLFLPSVGRCILTSSSP
ncbi:MAG: PD40 domain-containing protein [Anaerolineales bacterium]|nr:PD40 domain-containing protein [Anaerolineales bacterium]